jgi:hypothetical protein
VAELERIIEHMDCRIVGKLAEMSGSHCPIDKPCDRCEYEKEIRNLEKHVAELEGLISPRNAIPLVDLLGPLKSCPFCGSISLSNNDGETYCKNCEASAPTMSWQFRANESGLHPAKKPMEGGFSMEKFMAGVSHEDALALAEAFDETPLP